MILDRFEAPFSIDTPEMIDDDPIWLFPPLHHDLILEPTQDISKEISEIFQKSFKQQLQPKQVQMLNQIKIQDAVKMGLDTVSFVKLVQNNPKLVGVLMTEMNNSEYILKNQYIETLLNCPPSPETNEAVFLSKGVLTQENIDYYISKAIEICEKDRPQRLLRSLCSLLRTWFKSNSVNFTDDMIQIIKRFCLQFTDTKEAIELFQLLEKK